jgi:hypothetical protein
MSDRTALMKRARAFAAASAAIVPLAAAAEDASASDIITADDWNWFQSGGIFDSGGAAQGTTATLNEDGPRAWAVSDMLGPVSGADLRDSGNQDNGFRPGAFLFDFDGSLLETQPVGTEAFLFFDIDIDYQPVDYPLFVRGTDMGRGSIRELYMSFNNRSGPGFYEHFATVPSEGSFKASGMIPFTLLEEWSGGDGYRVSMSLGLQDVGLQDSIDININSLGVILPAPGAAGLLGVAGLAAVRRRR